MERIVRVAILDRDRRRRAALLAVAARANVFDIVPVCEAVAEADISSAMADEPDVLVVEQGLLRQWMGRDRGLAGDTPILELADRPCPGCLHSFAAPVTVPATSGRRECHALRERTPGLCLYAVHGRSGGETIIAAVILAAHHVCFADTPIGFAGDPLPALTAREQEVEIAIAEYGLNNAQIAGKLCVTEKTVEKHVTSLLQKLGYHSRYQIQRRPARP